MARNGVYSGGRTKAEYYKVWDLETGVYKGVWRIGARQRKMPSLFRYERVSPEKEEDYNKYVFEENQLIPENFLTYPQIYLDKRKLVQYSYS